MYELGSATDSSQGREILPTNVKPVNYKLSLEPNFETFTFDGEVSILLKVAEDSTEITVNSNDIKISSASVSGPKIGSQDANQISYDEGKERATFKFLDTIPAGNEISLKIVYVGNLNDNMAGFYRSSYTDRDGKTKYLATTQMEPTDARKALPCFDEPGLKATFDVTLIADSKLTCLSNMDVAGEKDLGSGKKAVTFNTSPPMSTYLLAFIVGDLRYIETNAFRVPVRVYALPGSEQLGKFSLDLAARTLEFYEKTFDSKYPLPKMDMVAIPDFSAGAMENWGLVTYRVVDLLFDEKVSGASTKQRVAEVVQHELAHQWFGNLVTMDFWEGLWLNEGFATWMSWYSCNVFYPEWKVWEGYVTDNLASALSLDSLRSSHPIEVPVKRADEVNQIFDAISYSKGSCVLRMVSKYLGEDIFMEGIRRYLKKHAFGNTRTEDLWESLSDASGKDVGKLMQPWTKKVGYPVVTVTEDGDKVRLKQNRFLRSGDVKPEEDQTIWPIFLEVKLDKGVDKDKTLTEREGDLVLPKDGFYKLNSDHSGIFRTSYPPERLLKLAQAAKDGRLSVEDKAGMVADAGALASSGFQKTSGVLGLLSGFKNEKDYVVWDEIITRISAVRGAWVFQPKEVTDALKTFLKDLTSDKAHELGWEFKPEDDHVLQQFKALMFSAAGSGGDRKVVDAAFSMFEKFSAGDDEAIHPNIRSSVYSLVMAEGGVKEYEILLKEYRSQTSSDRRNAVLRALGRCEEPSCIQKSLDLALSPEVRDQDIYMPIGGLRSHQAGINALWEWMQKNFDVLTKKLPPSLGMMGSVVSISTSGFTSKEAVTEIDTFFKDRSTKGFDKTLAQSLESVEAKVAWLDRDTEDVFNWLSTNGYLNKQKL